MRIYLDSNILRKLKGSSNQFNELLFNVVEALNESFVFLFSDAHLYDLSKSLEYYRNEDLILMERYVRNNYVKRDHIYSRLHYYLATPSEAYKSINFEKLNKVLENPYGFITDLVNSNDGLYGPMLNKLYNTPINDIKNGIDSDLSNNSSGESPTVNDIFKKTIGFTGFLNDKKEYKRHRKLLSEYVNRDDYSFEKWSFKFDEKMKDTIYKKTFTEMVDFLTPSDYKDGYDYFISMYMFLEHFGITQERTGSKQRLKENSFWDIHKDAMHAFFASKSDYFVTDDIGLQTKAFITYKLLNIQTEVLSVNDFIGKSILLKNNEDTPQSFLDGLVFAIKNGLVIRETVLQDIRLIKPLYPFFNYFNRIQLNTESGNEKVFLFKSYDIDYGIMYAEVNMLIKKCNKIFGESFNYKQENELSEIGKFNKSEPIREWRAQNHKITLSFEMNTLNQQIIGLIIWFNLID